MVYAPPHSGLSVLTNLTNPARHSVSRDVLRGCSSNGDEQDAWNAQLQAALQGWMTHAGVTLR